MKKAFCAIIVVLLYGCGSLPPPKDLDNVCNIFKQRQHWYWAAKEAEKRWGTPVYVQMAIMHQESHFHAKAKPARKKLLWFIPWKRPSSAYGYSQALTSTWSLYRKERGKKVDRNNFKDAVDFISWYGYQARRKLRLGSTDAYGLYLAYHEGMGGYKRKTYRNKKWLLAVAGKVQTRSSKYRWQIMGCANKLAKKPWYRVW